MSSVGTAGLGVLEAAIARIGLSVRQRRLPSTIQAIRAAVQRERTPTKALRWVAIPTLAEQIRQSLAIQTRRQGIKRIPSVAGRMRAALLADFHERVQVRLQRFITAVDEVGLPVPALSACGRGTREIRYTQLLGYYLDPKKPHGLHDLGLRVLFGSSVRRLLGADVDWTAAEVVPEFSDLPPIPGHPDASIDLVVVLPADSVIVAIEQKLFSSEGGSGSPLKQLQRYSAALSERFPACRERLVKIYLAPTEREYSDPSWQMMTHYQVIAQLREALRTTSLSSTARHNLAALLWDLATGPLAVESDTWETYVSLVREVLTHPIRYIGFPRRAGALIPHHNLLLDIIEAT